MSPSPSASERRRRSIAAAAAAALTLLAAPARGAGLDQRACTDSYTRAQSLRQASKLVSAREQLALCSTEICPQVFRDDCARWLSEVDAELPTVVVKVTGGDDKPATRYRVLLDGAPLEAAQIKGPIPVDPGMHTLNVERDGEPPITQEITLKPGDKDRVAEVRVASAETSRPSGVPLRAVIFGGVGLAALTVFGVAGAVGVSARSELEACKPRCASDDIGAVRRDFVVADISLGVGLVSLGVATYLFITRPRPKAPAATSALPRFDFTAGRGGAGGALRVAF